MQLNGTPVTAPSRGSCPLPDSLNSTSHGAPHVCIGDVVRVPIILTSNLPQNLSIAQGQLALNVLQVLPSSSFAAKVSSCISLTYLEAKVPTDNMTIVSMQTILDLKE